RLIFGDDGSAAADVVWLWINSHDWPGWTISVVTAHQPAEFAVLPPDRAELHPWQPKHPRELVRPATDTVLEHLTADADPRVVLDSCGDADLMVVGPRGRGALKQLHIGSTTEWLLVRPSPPVGIIRAGRATRRVAVCVDGSRHGVLATRTVAALPWIAGCEVTVLAVDDGVTDADGAIAQAGAILQEAGVEAHTLRADGRHRGHAAGRDVRSLILGELAALDVDLVALGTRGVGGLRRTFIGSTASAVALHATCSVIVAYDPAEERSEA
ncbi:MAG TPA: universal stress protein, partial [Gemmatimonadales bacterium]|nr:universal stress protein [Gemmatimonadales bacterium]